MTLSGATTPSQSGLGRDGNKGVLRIPQISSITTTLLSDCFVSYPGHSFDGGLQFIQTILIQLILFSISTDFIHS